MQDENILNKIENYILKTQTKDSESEFEPFTIDEFINRIEQSEQDFKNGKFKTQAELEKISENW